MATPKKTTTPAAVKKTTPAKTTQVQSKLSVDVLDLTGKKTGSVLLPESLFGAPVNKALMAQAIRVYRANQRLGTVKTKTRGEVTGSTRKIYRQKGTGRARHGAAKAPIFVHGGVAHGPKPADHSMAMPQKMRRAALVSALSSKYQGNAVRVLDGISSMEAKTKLFAAFMKEAGTNPKKENVLVILPNKMENVIKAIRNVEGVRFEMANLLNTYEVLDTKSLIIVKDALKTMEETFVRKEAK